MLAPSAWKRRTGEVGVVAIHPTSFSTSTSNAALLTQLVSGLASSSLNVRHILQPQGLELVQRPPMTPRQKSQCKPGMSTSSSTCNWVRDPPQLALMIPVICGAPVIRSSLSLLPRVTKHQAARCRDRKQHPTMFCMIALLHSTVPQLQDQCRRTINLPSTGNSTCRQVDNVNCHGQLYL